MRLLLLWMACLATLSHCIAQTEEDRSTYSVDVSKLDRFHLYGRRGPVTVKATNGKTATLQVTRTVSGSTAELREKARKEIYLDSMIRGNQLIFFVQHPYLKLEFDEDGHAYYNSISNWDWNSNKKEEQPKVEFAITLEIPAPTNLTVTNHEHPLQISGMQGDLRASNHHDGVLVENQGGSADVHSHHGDVEVFYTKNPSRACTYDTHHGDIRIHYQPGLQAEASLYSYHGQFYSAFDFQMKPMTVASEAGGKGAQYKISNSKGTTVQIGTGGPRQEFRSHHGSIYLMDKK